MTSNEFRVSFHGDEMFWDENAGMVPSLVTI